MPPTQNASSQKKSVIAALWPDWLVTLLVMATAAGLIMTEMNYAEDSGSPFSLGALNKRADMLVKVKDPIERDSLCVPLSAYGRSLDRALPKDARIFISGMLGETNGGKMGYYFFLRNYLFPREIELSLDGKAILTQNGCLGVPCDSPEELQKRGFDLMMSSAPNGAFQLTPLSQKGVPK